MKPILKWQYDQLVKELILLQGHDSDPTCPCQTEGEMCVRKHLMTIEALAQETMPIEADVARQEALKDLASDAGGYRKDEEKRLCGQPVEFPVDIAEWAREWRKQFEGYSLVCSLKGGNPMPDDREYLPHGLTEAEKDDPELQARLSSCIRQVEAKLEAGELPEGSKPVAICRASLESRHSPFIRLTYDISLDMFPEQEEELKAMSKADFAKLMKQIRLDWSTATIQGLFDYDLFDAKLLDSKKDLTFVTTAEGGN